MDYYEELGIHRDATIGEIREAYKLAVRLVHPDTQLDPRLKNLAECQMKRLSEVMAVLVNPGERARYDAGLAYGTRSGRRAAAGAGERPRVAANRDAAMVLGSVGIDDRGDGRLVCIGGRRGCGCRNFTGGERAGALETSGGAGRASGGQEAAGEDRQDDGQSGPHTAGAGDAGRGTGSEPQGDSFHPNDSGIGSDLSDEGRTGSGAGGAERAAGRGGAERRREAAMRGNGSTRRMRARKTMRVRIRHDTWNSGCGKREGRWRATTGRYTGCRTRPFRPRLLSA